VAIHFLLEPFLTNDDYFGLGGEGLVTDATVATSIALNSSMWVSGPFCHLRENESLIGTYYHIAAALTYCMTSEETFTTYIRSLSTEDECVSCEPWDIRFFVSPSCQLSNNR